jgi:energy-converting hydrogenase Eha subunit E
MPRQILLFRAWGTYYVVTGLWPLVHLTSFEAVAGPKTDDWLVHMVGLLAASIGLTLLHASYKGISSSIAVLALTSALAFAAIDIWYVSRQVISPIYLADALVEFVLVVVLMTTRPFK